MFFRKLVAEDLDSNFSTGNEDVDAFFRGAADAQRMGFAQTYVLRADDSDPGSLPPLIGFYAICMSSVERRTHLFGAGPGLPNKLPTALLAQLGRDKRIPNGMGIGSKLLADALRRITAISPDIGCCGVTVDAADEKLVAYYKRFGFLETGLGRKLFVHIGTVSRATTP